MKSEQPVTHLSVAGNIAILSLRSPPVNALSQPVRAGLIDGIRCALADPEVDAIVLICEGNTFSAGFDIAEFGAFREPGIDEVAATLEQSTKPIVAAVHGTALGGGLEIALCCHYRIGVPSAKCGLPEVKLGLVPGAGGTQRLPRIVGPELALDVVCLGRLIEAATAHATGLFDALVNEGELSSGAIRFAQRIVDEAQPLKKIRDRQERLLGEREASQLFADFRRMHARKFGRWLAPEYGVRCIEGAMHLPFEEGLALERRLFIELLESEQSAAQRYVFFAERQVWKIPDLHAGTPVTQISKVGIVGAGTMGGGIAMSFASVGIPVTLLETQHAALERGIGVIRKHYETSAQRGKLSSEDAAQRTALLTMTLDAAQLADCDLIIEAVYEDMQIKKDVFAMLDRIVKPGALLASNTSFLDVNELAAVTRRPERVLGLHFFSPANVMRLLEVVRGRDTSPQAIATAMQLAKRIGKIAVLVGVCRGFVGNRMLEARQRQAVAMMSEGAMPWDIDAVLVEFGMPMGPFAMYDLAGLDIGWSRATSRRESVRDRLCEIDRRGQKTSAGFYDYDSERRARPSAVTAGIIEELIAARSATARPHSPTEILERCLFPMINEGAKILEERIALRPSDIDMIWINGYGWPVYRGGPLFYADTIGLRTIVAKLERYTAQLDAGFSVSPLLRELVLKGRRFRDLQPN